MTAIRAICANQWTTGIEIMRQIQGLSGPEIVARFLASGGDQDGFLVVGERNIPLRLRFSGVRRDPGTLLIEEVPFTDKCALIHGADGVTILRVHPDLPKSRREELTRWVVGLIVHGTSEGSPDRLNTPMW